MQLFTHIYQLKLIPPTGNTCIININYLAAIENSTQRCRLCPPFDKLELTVSRRYFSKLKEQFELL
ncbi:MAG: hypothetical protein U0K28_04050 [Prevotellamassilia sp.]|nr:hypothetical protein [Prevotellamassilia sp.]